MRRVEAEALVGASRDEVWQLYDDIRGTPRWVPFVSEILYVSGPARVGTVYRERTRLGGLPTIEQWEIVEHRPADAPGARLVRATAMESALIIRFEGRGTGTWVHQAAELRSRLWGPFGWLHELLVVDSRRARACAPRSPAPSAASRRARPAESGADQAAGSISRTTARCRSGPAPSRVTWYSISRAVPSSRAEAERRVELAALEELAPQRTEVVEPAVVSSGFANASTGWPEDGLAGRLDDLGQGRRDLDEQAVVVEDRPRVPGLLHQRRPGRDRPEAVDVPQRVPVAGVGERRPAGGRRRRDSGRGAGHWSSSGSRQRVRARARRRRAASANASAT